MKKYRIYAEKDGRKKRYEYTADCSSTAKEKHLDKVGSEILNCFEFPYESEKKEKKSEKKQETEKKDEYSEWTSKID